MRRRGPGRAVLWSAMLGVAAGCTGDGGAANRFMTIGTAGTGGLYYPIGGAFASRLSERDTTRTYTVEVTGGSVENIQRVMTGEMDLGFAIGTTVFEAYHGGQGFDTAQTRLRVVAPLYPNLTHVLVLKDAAISTIADLRGRRVSVGAAGSGTEQVARQLLAVHGMDFQTVDARFLRFNESAAALGEGAIDAAVFSVGYPASAVLEATGSGRVRLLPIDPRYIRVLVDRHAYYSEGTIPAGAYPGQDEDLPTISVLNWIVARDDLADDVVAYVLDALAEDIEILRHTMDITGQINLANLYAAPIPLHAAAREWVQHGSPADSAGSTRE